MGAEVSRVVDGEEFLKISGESATQRLVRWQTALGLDEAQSPFAQAEIRKQAQRRVHEEFLLESHTMLRFLLSERGAVDRCLTVSMLTNIIAAPEDLDTPVTIRTEDRHTITFCRLSTLKVMARAVLQLMPLEQNANNHAELRREHEAQVARQKFANQVKDAVLERLLKTHGLVDHRIRAEYDRPFDLTSLPSDVV